MQRLLEQRRTHAHHEEVFTMLLLLLLPAPLPHMTCFPSAMRATSIIEVATHNNNNNRNSTSKSWITTTLSVESTTTLREVFVSKMNPTIKLIWKFLKSSDVMIAFRVTSLSHNLLYQGLYKMYFR